MSEERPAIWPAAAVFATTCLCFGQLLGFAFLEWDDTRYILQNPLVHPETPWPDGGFLTVSLGYPIPVTVLCYRAVAVLFGLSAAAFHGLNVVLHATNAALFYGLLRRMTTPTAALVGAACWALHPLVVEPVAWC